MHTQTGNTTDAKQYKTIPTFTKEDLERINREGLTKKEATLWVTSYCLSFVLVALSGIAIAFFVSAGASYITNRAELADLITEAKAIFSYAGEVAIVLTTLFLIPHCLGQVEDIKRHECGVISFPVFIELYKEDKSRWDILSNHSVALLGQGPRFGLKHYIILFFPPWERPFITLKINKLMKEANADVGREVNVETK